MRPALLLCAVLLAGCKAHMIELRGESPRLTSDGFRRDPKGGVIRWLANGPQAFRKARRADAEAQMRGYCGGDYAITAEGPRSKLGATVAIPSAGVEFDQWWYAAFDCAAD